ncbi:unnamed protein product, partial [Laminaria digitata]
DGTVILWRERLAHESAASPDTAAGPTTPADTAAPKISGGHGGQLVPAAIMRGHSGAHVWRLAVHELDPCPLHHDDRFGGSCEFDPRSIDNVSRSGGSCRAPSDAGIIAERSPGRGLVLMATGGNDGASKL